MLKLGILTESFFSKVAELKQPSKDYITGSLLCILQTFSLQLFRYNTSRRLLLSFRKSSKNFSELFRNTIIFLHLITFKSREQQKSRSSFQEFLEFFWLIAQMFINLLPANPTKWSYSLKQLVACCRRIVWVCLTILWGWHSIWVFTGRGDKDNPSGWTTCVSFIPYVQRNWSTWN